MVRSGESGVSLFLFLRPLFFLPFSVFRFSFVSFLPFVVGGLQFGGIHILLTNGPQQRDRDATGGRVCGLRFFFFLLTFRPFVGLDSRVHEWDTRGRWTGTLGGGES